MTTHFPGASIRLLVRLWLLGLTVSSLSHAALAAETAKKRTVDFNRDIRPILSGKCFKCHGPDEETREADLRLDEFESATESGAILPGNSQESEFVRRILSNDPDEQMPPLSSNKTLSPDEKELLIRWINSGAKYEQHWSFIRPTLPEVPRPQGDEWSVNEIDRFILKRLQDEGLSPAHRADSRALIRRVFLDLIGLPPSPEEAAEWLSRIEDSNGNFNNTAYEQLVGDLLSRPQYGERWARRWLDLARYADTNGYEKDRDRTMWPYRDWVIRALNADMPFDQFTIEQVAGDMLPNATVDQRIATGFHRNTMLNEEGGIDPLEFRFYAMTDRVATTGTTWLGLTTGCCQCHTHKYDPITHREYYGLMAFLNNADEPDLNLPDQAAVQRHQNNLAQAEQLLSRLADQWPGADPDKRETALQKSFNAWLKTERELAVDWQVLRPSKLKSNLPHLAVQDDGSIFASGDTTKFDTYELRFDNVPAGTTALRLEALPDERLPAHGPGSTYYEGRKGDFFLNEFALSIDGQPLKITSASHSYAKNQFGRNPVSAALTIDGDYQTGWSAASRPGERSVAVYNLATSIGAGKTVDLKMTFGRHFASSLGRFRLSATVADGLKVAREWTPEIENLLKASPASITYDERLMLKKEFLLNAPPVAKHAAKIRQLRRRPSSIEIPVLAERPGENPRPTHLHHRGEYLQPKDRIEAIVPAALHRFPEDKTRNRLEFARWLVSRNNPLTARVVANRHWAAFFGTGIVKTLDDFGMQGESPSHPELLDWLAVTLMEDGWSLKKLHRRIVLSKTYQQSSNVIPQPGSNVELSSRSTLPATRLLARFPRTRLEAEIIRDVVLKAAGLLSLKQGGPPVRPPQPDGISEASFGRPKWRASTGEDRYRRSVYTYQKRTAPFAMLTTFDAPSGEACVARRDVSNTALQALTLLNDEMFLEAARALGKLLAESNNTDRDRIALAFDRVLTRPPSATEMARLLKFVSEQRSLIFDEHKAVKAAEFEAAVEKAQRQEAARKKAATEQSESSAVQIPTEPKPVDKNAVETNVWTNVARALFSLDETLTKN